MRLNPALAAALTSRPPPFASKIACKVTLKILGDHRAASTNHLLTVVIQRRLKSSAKAKAGTKACRPADAIEVVAVTPAPTGPGVLCTKQNAATVCALPGKLAATCGVTGVCRCNSRAHYVQMDATNGCVLKVPADAAPMFRLAPKSCPFLFGAAGSTDVTSDIDVNLKDKGDANFKIDKEYTSVIAQDFNVLFRQLFEAPSGFMTAASLWDVNTYPADYIMQGLFPKRKWTSAANAAPVNAVDILEAQREFYAQSGAAVC